MGENLCRKLHFGSELGGVPIPGFSRHCFLPPDATAKARKKRGVTKRVKCQRHCTETRGKTFSGKWVF
ncbi:hypothetical protein PVL29_009569 [Vitis rotundifolia]|uniref:Uncharacterized protein n=1 Tax=Vitis rotundifolia TaxID=103349 RepID=A0AA38ZQZ7_VITRO|nr:hypothetical protein PVL29_009569 [Vitis rotundifolia]